MASKQHQIRQWLKKTKVAETRLSHLAVDNPHAVRQMREGTLKDIHVDAIHAFILKYPDGLPGRSSTLRVR